MPSNDHERSTVATNATQMATPPPPHLATLALVAMTDETYQEFDDAVARGFQEEVPAEHRDPARAVVEPQRFFGFHTGARWISTFGSYARQLTVPGGEAVPVSAITNVTVHSAFRRRGVLRQSMAHEFDLCRERGESIAILYASESGIYGRFGFGNAASETKLAGPTDALVLRPDVATALAAAGGSVDEVDEAAFVEMVRGVHDRLRTQRPGSLDRPDAWWRVKLSDPPAWRDGATALRFVVSYDASGAVDGHATYQVKEADDNGNPNGVAIIRELEGADASAQARLWRYVAGLDLVRRFTMNRAPVEHELTYLLANPRAVATRVQDALYVRLLDVAAALSARRYGADVDTVIEVVDDFQPACAGRFALSGSPRGAEARRTDRPAEMTLAARDLAAVYLGGVSLAALHRAGLVAEHRRGAVDAAAAAFLSPVAPFCADMF